MRVIFVTVSSFIPEEYANKSDDEIKEIMTEYAKTIFCGEGLTLENVRVVEVTEPCE